MRNVYRLLYASLLTCYVVLLAACPPKYGNIMKDSFRAALGKDFSEYSFLSYPTNNFGVATMYYSSYDPKNYLCATWTCLGYTSANIPTDKTKILDIDDYADVGDGGSINLTTDQQRDIGVNVVVPQIYNMLQVNAGADWQKHVTLSLVATSGHRRFLQAPKFAGYLNSLPAADKRRQAYSAGQLTVILSDLVIDSMKVTIDIDTTFAANLDTQLTSALSSKVGTVIGKGADLKFEVNSATKGHYELQTVQPVIVAVLPQTEPPPPRTYALGAAIPVPEFKAWKHTKVDVNKIRSSTSKPLQ